MKKKPIVITITAIVIICIIVVALIMFDNKGNTSNVNRIAGYSALYSEELINKAFDVIEEKFSSDFEGCTLTELK